MIDPFGRPVNYLRLSVTDRCNFRCTYCMAEEMTFLPRKDILSIEELERVSLAFIRLGVDKIRITGGEPLVRQGLMTLLQTLAIEKDAGRLNEITMTTNGVLLDRYAQQMVDYGVRRINVSLDSLNEERFKKLTRNGDLQQVLAGIAAADKAGLKIKINAVALAGVNDDEFDSLVQWCGDRGYDLTLIESMPMGEIGEERSRHFLTLDEVQKKLEKTWTLEHTDYKTGGPASYHVVRETGQRLGLITPFSHNFCESCNRVRVSCTGQLYLCLGQDDMVDLRDVLRASSNDMVLKQTILEGINKKPKGHDFDAERLGDGAQVVRFMSHTGG